MIDRTEALKKWLAWDDRTEEGQMKFYEATGWLPLTSGQYTELICVLKNPA